MPNTTLGISHDLYQSKRYIHLLTQSRFIVITSYIVKMLLLSALCFFLKKRKKKKEKKKVLYVYVVDVFQVESR